MQNNDDGWEWFGNSETSQQGSMQELALSYARCFRGPDGQRVIKHLRTLTMDQALGPAASEAMLRHLEGQRQLVTYIHGLIERGRGNTGKENENE